MARTPIDYAPVFAYIVAHPEETLGAVAAAFEINRSTLGAAVKHESDKPGGGRLAGHPTYGKPSTSTTDAGEAAAVYVPVAELVPWVKNPRRNDAAAEQVADSIIRFGFGAPLLARLANREVIAGHTRIKAAHLLPARHRVLVATVEGGPDEETRERAAAKLRRWHPEAVALATDAIPRLPVRYRDLSETEAHALALADNRLGELAEWDGPVLAEVAQGFGADFDTTGMGWGDVAWGEIATFEEPPAPNPTTDPGPPPVMPGPATSVAGEMYLLGPHRLVCGDSRDRAVWELLLGGERLQMVWTDPPYGVAVNDVADVEEAKRLHRRTDGKIVMNDALTPEELEALLTDSLGEAVRRSVAGAGWYVAAPPGPLHTTFAAVLSRLDVWRRSLIWLKDRFAFGRGDYHYRHEPIFYGWVPGAAHYFIDDRTQDSVLEFPRPARSPEHPTMKPIELVERCILNSSKPGWIVGEPFGGSGTTLLAAARTGRFARLIELSPHYCDVIRRRWTRWAKDAGVDPGPGALE